MAKGKGGKGMSGKPMPKGMPMKKGMEMPMKGKKGC